MDWRARTQILAFLTLALAPASGVGQVVATPPVPPGHWAYLALDRMAAGLIDGEWAIGHRPQSAGVMMALVDSS